MSHQKEHNVHRNWHIPVLLAIPLTGLASDISPPETQFAPPPYQALRFNENYRYLSDSAKATDLFDPIKYIPLRSNNPSWYLTLGGEVRERYEGQYNPNFGIVPVPNSQWLQRATLLADVHLGDRVRAFAEGISGLIAGESVPASIVQDDPLDLAAGFIDVVPYLNGDERFTLRGGRFSMTYGSGRLVATRAGDSAPNIPFRFDGFEAIYSAELWQGTSFLVRPVENSDGISGSDSSITFWGLYLTHWFDLSHKRGVDLYYFGHLNNAATYASGTAAERRQTFGMRMFGKLNGWDWNEENVLQVGSFGDQSIIAWTASLDAGYTFKMPWEPRLGCKVDVISGDGNSTDGRQETFNALYPNPTYFNDAKMIRPANLIDVHPTVSVSPTRGISINSSVDFAWRYSRSDGVYAPSGSVAIPALGNAPTYVTTALDVNLEWKMQRHVTLLASYVHSFTGNYVHAAGGSDGDYTSVTLSFLF